MEILSRIDELEKKMNMLVGKPITEKEASKKEAPEEEPVTPEANFIDFEEKLTPELLERFHYGLLQVLGELELEGRLPAMETPSQIKSALNAVVRQLYIRKSMISKMGRVFARFGAKRFLRKQRSAIGKAMTAA